MKNIYHDDNFNKDSQDIFSKTSFDLMKEFTMSKPEKPQAPQDIDFREKEEPVIEEKPAAKQAPPPIKRTAPPVQPAPTAQTPPSAFYVPAGGAFVQPNYYPPQPAAYPPPQAYPVYMASNPPYPPYPQAQPIPVVYPQVPGAYPQPIPVYPQPPVMQVPSAPYQTPEQNPYHPVTPAQPDPMSTEAGTRVLFQSPDFDIKEDAPADGGYDAFAPQHTISTANLDISEVELPSRKRAGTPSGDSAEVSFKIDDMEISTYELNAMSLSRSTKVTGVDMPIVEAVAEKPVRNSVEESYAAEEVTEQENPTGIFPDEVLADDEGKNKSKKLSGKEITRRVVLAVALIAIVVSCGMLYNEYRLHKENEKAMNSISDLIITEPPTETTVPSTTKAPSAGEEATTEKATTTTRPTTTRYLTPSEQLALLKKENPDIKFPDNLQPKYAKLYAENQDFVGYLSVAGTDLDFPVVQGIDNDEYLERNFFGEYTKYGCPFMDYRNNPQNLDRNTIIYGHNMQDGSLFACLEQYLTLEGYKKAPVISYNTLYQDLDFKIIATIITNINPEDDNGYVFPYYWTTLNSAINYTAYLNQLSQRSLYDTGVGVLPTDRILTLSTCYDEFEDARLVVVARLVRPGESVEVNTAKAVENSNPRFPQAYYDEHGKANPFANAYRWEIS